MEVRDGDYPAYSFPFGNDAFSEVIKPRAIADFTPFTADIASLRPLPPGAGRKKREPHPPGPGEGK